MSAVVPESLHRTHWSDPLHVLVIAPQPNVSSPDQRPGRWLRPPRLPEPPPLVSDLSVLSDGVVIDTVAAAAAVVEKEGSALVNAAVKNFEHLVGNSSDSPGRELLRSRPRALPVRNLRRVHRQTTRRLLQYEKDIKSTDTKPQMHSLELIPNTRNTTHDPTWYESLSTDLENLDGMQVGLALALVVLFFIFAVGVLRGWWCQKNAHIVSESQEYNTFDNELAHKTPGKINNYDI
jgi:hypothetical protein